MQHIEHLQQMEQGSVATGLWVPGEYCAIHQLDTPNAPRRKWPLLLPWLLEERLLSPVENNHLVIMGESDGKLSVLSVAKDRMRSWLQRVEAVEPQRLLPDYLALPWQEGSVSISLRNVADGAPVWLVRYGHEAGFAAAPQLALTMLRRLLDKLPTGSLRAYCTPADVPESLRALQPEICGAVDWQAPPTSRFNLLTEEFKTKATLKRRPLWLPTAAMLVVTVALCFVWLHSANGRLAREVASYREAEQAEFYRRFPGIQLQAGDVRTTVEQLVNDRFLQRQQLQSPTAAMLQELDKVISDCDCRVNSLQLDVIGGQLQLAAPVAAASFSEHPGLTLQAAQADAENQTLVVSPELL